MGLSRLLAEGAVDKHSGIATAVRGKHKRLFCLDQGQLVFAASNVIEEQFSELLIREKLIAATDLAAAHAASEQLGIKLTRLLVDEKVVDRQALERLLEQHVRDLLFTTLDWPDGEASLARGNPDLGEEVTTSLSCISLLLEYTNQHPASLQEVQRRVGPANDRLQVAVDRNSILDGTDSRPALRDLLERCDGVLPIGDVVRASPEPEEPTWRALYGLLLIGALAPVAKTDAAAKRGTVRTREEILNRLEHADMVDHYALLRVSSACTRDEVLRAYYVVARDYHPDRYRTGPLQDLRERMETYFARVTEAYNTLYDPDRRKSYDVERSEEQATEITQDTAELAKQNFKRARSLIAKGRFADAVPWLENAVQQDAPNASYRVELGKLMARNPRMRQEAEEHLIQANRLDPSLVDGYLALGDLYLKQADPQNATRMFHEVLRWEPGHVEASARLKQLG
jgi:tetratricopeptide (TPR) repeat protein